MFDLIKFIFKTAAENNLALFAFLAVWTVVLLTSAIAVRVLRSNKGNAGS